MEGGEQDARRKVTYFHLRLVQSFGKHEYIEIRRMIRQLKCRCALELCSLCLPRKLDPIGVSATIARINESQPSKGTIPQQDH